ncbi:MAG: hypothetical protein EXR99_04620 [Gemmataceae bacterium]|nr:hypothetical protein [Gemmataceae bacterium]
MLRKIWLASVFMALTGTGLLLSNPVATKANPGEKTRLITVNETGKGPVKCKILQEWKTPEGSKAFKVEAVDTGETMTVLVMQTGTVETGKGKNSSMASTKIYHWGKAKTCPVGFPQPPSNLPLNNVVSQPKNSVPPGEGKVPVKTAVRTSPEVPMKTAIQEGKKPAPLTLPVFQKSSTETAKGSGPIEFQTVPAPGAGHIAVVPSKNETAKIAAKGENKTPVRSALSGLVDTLGKKPEGPKNSEMKDKIIILKEEKTWVKTTTGPEKILKEHVLSVTKKEENTIPVAVAKSSTPPAKVEAAPAPKALPKEMAKKSEIPAIPNKKLTVPTITVSQEKKKTPEAAKTLVASKETKPATEPAKPQDWRKSWGNLKEEKIPEFPIKRVKEEKLPLADPTKPDPLKSVNELHPALEEKIAKRASRQMGKNAAERELEAILPGKEKIKMPAQMAEASMPRKIVKDKPVQKPVKEEIIIVERQRAPFAAKWAVPFGNVKEEMQAGGEMINKTLARISGVLIRPFTRETRLLGPRIPQGSGSVLAAGAPPLYMIPMWPVDRPHGPAPHPYQITPPQAPNPFAHLGVNQPHQAGRSTTNGMGNAFTSIGNTRPIPADLAGVAPAGNAFSVPPSPEASMENPPTMMARMTMPMNPGFPGAAFPPGANNLAMMQPQVQMQQYNLDLVGILKSAIYPSQREWAAEQLGAMGAQGNPAIGAILLSSAKEDPAPMVRASCLRALRGMKIHNMEVMEAIQALRTDTDPRVRSEADLILIQLTGAKLGSR